MASVMKYLLILFTVACATSDEIDIQLTSGTLQKLLRVMTNETQGADSLNLPANASSIRENITDTFSCENRTYGYYADVDNECQVFHVCLPSQTPSGRNVTYKWSFICPNETIFNQEVLVCTRPIDSIPCEDSPMYYDLNMEIGKVPNNTRENDISKEVNTEPVKEKVRKNQSRKPVRKQNLVQDLLQEVVDEEIKQIDEIETINDVVDVEGTEEIVPVLIDPNYSEPKLDEVDEFGVDDKFDGRLVEERSMPWTGRKLHRGVFRFKADV